MKSHFDFPSSEGRLEWEAEEYDLSHENWHTAWTLLATFENIRELYDFVSETGGKDADDGRLFQHLMVKKGANALEALYWLVKHHQYDAARSRARYLYETYLVLRGLNRDQNQAAKKWEKTRQEAKRDIEESDLKPLEEQPDALHGLRKSERKRVERTRSDSDAYGDLWQLLSDRGSHPTSIKGASVNSRHSVASEDSLLQMGLAFAFGITAQYVRTFGETPTRKNLQKRADHIFVEIKLALLPMQLPTLFQEELYFWNPALTTSPFVADDDLVPD